MRTIAWRGRLAAILAVALASAVAAASLPDNPYQRWQLVENTLYANATWGYERIVFDPRPIDVAVIGASRTQMGISAPRVEADLRAAGLPLGVANLSVIEDGRNLEWAVADTLFRHKRPRLLVVAVAETPNRWGHPGFKYVAPATAVARPLAALLHNAAADAAYLPYRQMLLFAAARAPGLVGLRAGFDPAAYAAKPDDYTVTRRLADGKVIDMAATVPDADLRAEAAAFAATRRPTRLPGFVTRVTDRDNAVYTDAIVRLARAHGARVLFLFIPEYGSAATIAGRARYAGVAPIADDGDLAVRPELYQSFAHLNRRGAMIASDRLAGTIAGLLRPTAPATPDRGAAA